MEADPFEESLFFAALYPADVEKLNEALEPLGLTPNRSPDDARARGRYVLENGEHVDVMTSPSIPGADPALSLDEA